VSGGVKVDPAKPPIFLFQTLENTAEAAGMRAA